MPTVRSLLEIGAHRLPGDGARREAEILLVHVLGRPRAWLVAHADDAIAGAQIAAFGGLVARRAAGEPVAYLIGTRGFHALDLEVTPNVLIPRPETERLVELALQRIPVDGGLAIADLGTGSGAVALAIAKARPRARVLATDVSEAALEVGRRNACRNGVDNVRFAQGDWCDALGEAGFDLIISNPPYVAEGDPHLARGDLRFEPRAALVSGPDGLDAIRVIVACAATHLKPDGWLLLEHGSGQGAAARELLARAGYRNVFTSRDLEARDRVSGGRALPCAG